MTKLSDTQAVILSTASQREDGAVLPLPETLKIKGSALDRVLGSLKAKGLIDHQGMPRGDSPPPLCITRAGLEAIGVETEAIGVETEDDAQAGPSAADKGAPPAGAGGAAAPAKRKAKGKAKARKAAPAERPTPRAGTKQAVMIEMLKRPQGATVEQIAAATGWQHHTIRGAISGALKKKQGPNRRGSPFAFGWQADRRNRGSPDTIPCGPAWQASSVLRLAAPHRRER